jgi:chromosome segregation ATPase
VEAKLDAAKAELRLAAEINEAALDDRIDAYQKLTAAEAAIHELEESVSALESERNALGAKLSVETHENNRWEGICDEMEAKLATADALLREAREAFRVGVTNCCLPKNRLVYLPERWDEQAKDVCE